MRKKKSLFLGAVIFAAMFLFSREGLALEDLPSDSSAARSLVETTLTNNADDDATQLLTEIISSESYNDIKDWATTQYYTLAQKKDGIDPAVKKLEAVATKKDKKLVGLERGIAEGYVRLGDWAKVAEIYADLVKDNPNDSILSTRMIDACMLNRDYDTVIKILEPRVAANPDDIASSDILAHAYVGAQRTEDVIALYKKRVEKEPKSPGLRGRYAQALLDLGKTEDSLLEWNEAFKLDPSNLLFKQRTAEAYTQLGDTKKAKKEYTELLNLIPENQTGFKDTIASRVKDIEAQETKEDKGKKYP